MLGGHSQKCTLPSQVPAARTLSIEEAREAIRQRGNGLSPFLDAPKQNQVVISNAGNVVAISLSPSLSVSRLCFPVPYFQAGLGSYLTPPLRTIYPHLLLPSLRSYTCRFSSVEAETSIRLPSAAKVWYRTTSVVYQIQPQCSSVNIWDPDVQQQLVLSKLQMQQLFSSGTEQLKAQPWWAIWLLQLVTLETLKQCKEMTKGPIKRPKNKIHLVIFMGII